MKFKVLVASVLAAATLLGAASIAGAAPEPSGSDDLQDRIVGSGSDTTYAFSQLAERLYNQAPGCDTDNSFASPTYAQCLTGAAQLQTETRGNWDHDYAVSKFPTGSGAGIAELNAGQVNYARSSRGPNASGESALNFWGFAKDGIAVVTMGNRTPLANLTLAQLQGIYNCSITQWSAITGNPADTQTIEPVGMNASSGTKATFQGFLGFDPNAGACVKRLPDPDGAGPLVAQFPFENDLKPVLAAANINEDNAIWWMSYGEYRAFNYKRQSAQAVSAIDGISISSATISNNTYPFRRFIYHVTTKADATNDAATENVLGANGGPGGAVREFTEFLCKGSTSHATNAFTGNTNYAELTAVYSQTGFIRLPTGDRTNGICRLVPGP